LLPAFSIGFDHLPLAPTHFSLFLIHRTERRIGALNPWKYLRHPVQNLLLLTSIPHRPQPLLAVDANCLATRFPVIAFNRIDIN
jgi:hypothetical protein